jgi:hypothetical protein
MKRLKNIFVGLFLTLVVCVPAVADNGCESDDNDAIVAELALCSTHAYNIGLTENPTGADKELMRDVIAMKTTLITQQMYRQYEQMDSMLRRLKTQLEKAVLTTGLEAKGASSSSKSSSGGSSFKSDDKYVVLAGTENCMQKGSIDSAVSCIQSNVRIVMSAISAGNTTDARKQLEKDLDVASVWGIISLEKCSGEDKDKSCEVKGFGDKGSAMGDCTSMMKGTDRKKNTLSGCANSLNVQIGLYVDNRNRQAQQKKQ